MGGAITVTNVCTLVLFFCFLKHQYCCLRFSFFWPFPDCEDMPLKEKLACDSETTLHALHGGLFRLPCGSFLSVGIMEHSTEQASQHLRGASFGGAAPGLLGA